MGVKTLALLVVLQCMTLCCLPAHVEGIRIAAYNVRIFGTSKLKNTVAMNMITQVRHFYYCVDILPEHVFVINCVFIIMRSVLLLAYVASFDNQ